MSVGFGSTYGAGSTDVVTTKYTGGAINNMRSISLWLFRNGASNGASILGTTTANGFEFIDYTTSPNAITYRRKWSGGLGSWSGSGTGSSGVWHHILITYNTSSSANAPVFYQDGILASTTTNVGVSGTLQANTTPYVIGNQTNNSVWNGMAAHVAIWDGIILSPIEALALASGVSPLLIYPELLGLYMPLSGAMNPEIDMINGSSSSITGSKLGTSDPQVMSQFMTRSLYIYETGSISTYAPIVARSMSGAPNGARNFVGL